MKWITSIILLLTLSSSVEAQDQRSVEIYRVEKEGYLELYVKNNNVYPVTFELDLELINLESNLKIPHTGILMPRSNRKLLELKHKDPSLPWDYRSTYTYYMGNILANHDNRIAYRLPYPKGIEHRVDQGFGGTFSHQGDMEYALDISMPEGSEIYAARGGKVVLVKEDSDRGGPEEDMMEFANYITVMHNDGTFADYTHIRKNGAVVEEGQEVKTAQLIGYSGSTGYVTGPHLHFVVKKTKMGGGFSSIPVRFITKDGIRELVEGQRYLAY